jgi:hypothetical protein
MWTVGSGIQLDESPRVLLLILPHRMSTRRLKAMLIRRIGKSMNLGRWTMSSRNFPSPSKHAFLFSRLRIKGTPVLLGMYIQVCVLMFFQVRCDLNLPQRGTVSPHRCAHAERRLQTRFMISMTLGSELYRRIRPSVWTHFRPLRLVDVLTDMAMPAQDVREMAVTGTMRCSIRILDKLTFA